MKMQTVIKLVPGGAVEFILRIKLLYRRNKITKDSMNGLKEVLLCWCLLAPSSPAQM